MLLYDIKRAFRWKWYGVGMLLVTAIAMLVKMDTVAGIFRENQLLEHGWTRRFIMEGVTDDAMLFLFPVLCTFPYASCFIEEYKEGILRFSLTRIDKRRYLQSKIMVTAVSGGCILVIGAAAFSLISVVLFFPLELPGETGQGILASMMPVLQIYARLFCFGALCALAGLLISTASNSRYMAWIGSFMAVYLLIIFCERYFESCIVLYPAEWLKPSEIWPLNTWSVCIWMILLAIFTAWLYMLSAMRRMQNA